MDEARGYVVYVASSSCLCKVLSMGTGEPGISHAKAQRRKENFCAFCAFLRLGSVLDAEGAHASIQVTAIDAHQLGRA
jgi:hypothetical protein